jgi:hypothetical protein
MTKDEAIKAIETLTKIGGGHERAFWSTIYGEAKTLKGEKLATFEKLVAPCKDVVDIILVFNS